MKDEIYDADLYYMFEISCVLILLEGRIEWWNCMNLILYSSQFVSVLYVMCITIYVICIMPSFEDDI